MIILHEYLLCTATQEKILSFFWQHYISICILTYISYQILLLLKLDRWSDTDRNSVLFCQKFEITQHSLRAKMLICQYCHKHSGIFSLLQTLSKRKAVVRDPERTFSLRDSLIWQERRCLGDCPQGHINHREQRSRLRDQGLSPPHYSAMVIVLLTLWHPLIPTSFQLQTRRAGSCSPSCCAVPACLRS